jgi:TetR/AcrR family transcriptional repressor of lmrAB and yxaGH operons
MADQPSSRERLLDAATDLFQRQGYEGTGLNELLAASGAPRGSLYHHFPGGKEQIGAEAVGRAGGRIGAAIEHVVATAPSVGVAVTALADAQAAGLEHSGFELGCPIATTALEVSTRSAAINEQVTASFDRWTAPIAAALRAEGHGADDAAARADLVVCTLEGALLLARARRDGDVLRRAAASLQPLLEGAS